MDVRQEVVREGVGRWMRKALTCAAIVAVSLTLLPALNAFAAGAENSGAALAWGNNFHGKLGDGTTTDRGTPVAVSDLTRRVVAVSAGLSAQPGPQVRRLGGRLGIQWLPPGSGPNRWPRQRQRAAALTLTSDLTPRWPGRNRPHSGKPRVRRGAQILTVCSCRPR